MLTLKEKLLNSWTINIAVFAGAMLYFWRKSYMCSITKGDSTLGAMLFVSIVYLIYFAVTGICFALENSAYKSGSREAFSFRIKKLPLYYKVLFGMALILTAISAFAPTTLLSMLLVIAGLCTVL